MSKILLSVLVPAYQFPDGVARILNGFSECNDAECEIIIFDDSKNDSVKEAYLAIGCAHRRNVRYMHSQPSLGAVHNWNALLDTARGEYCLLMHHDEFPMGDHFVRDLVATLRKHPDTDVVMLDCVLVAPNTGRNRRHLPIWLRALVVNHFPQYIFRRNVIGPTAALVVRRSMYPRFDARLQWLVDVDVYVRLLRVAKHFRLCTNIRIGSVLGRSDSITARLGSSIPKINQEERAYLQGKRSVSSFWLGPYPNEPVVHGLLRAFETVCWRAMRGLTRVVGQLYPCPIPRSEAKKALRAQQLP